MTAHKKAIFALSLLLFSLPFSALAARPDETMNLLQKAVDSRDSGAVEKYIDLNAVIGDAMNTLLPMVTKAVDESKLNLDPTIAAILTGVNSGNAASKLMATQLVVSETRKFVIYGVKTGSFAGKPVPANGLDGGLFLQFGGIDQNRKEFMNSKTLEEKGRQAVVATSVKDYYDNSVYNLLLDMEEQNGTWRVTRIKNVGDMLNLVFR